MTLRVSKEKPSTTERLDRLKDVVDGKGCREVGLSVCLPQSHIRNSSGLTYRYSVLCAQ